MATLPETQAELEALRAKVAAESRAARDAGDTARREQLRALIGEIDDELDRLALADLQAAANRLVSYRTRLEALTRAVLSWPFGSAEAPANHERPFRAKELPANDFADAGPTAPPPAPEPLPPTTVPQVSADWSENYRQLWNALTFSNADWQKQATAIARKIVANQARYAAAVAGTPVPWWFVAVVHCMECSMRFDQHLHNGDPLSARTTHVPPGRPLAGSPPFTWEQSAHDAMQFERLDRVTDWSLPNVLFNWHRYNGINNEYKRRGIPTPYLWSGSTHYKKGKYVADGVFDSEFVSRQLGAAVILRALVDLGAVTVDQQQVAPAANPATTATANTPATPAANPAAVPAATPPQAPVSPVTVDATAAAIPHIARELAYPGLLKQGANTETFGVRRVQEWLRIHGFAPPLDSVFGSSTADQLKAFQASQGRPSSGELDEQTWNLLTAPMRRALVKIENAGSMSLDDLAIAIAKQHLAQKPVEVGGNNLGPWVRLYMAGDDGKEQLWCAGFVCFVVAQACRELKIEMPFKRRVGVPLLVDDARASGRLVNAAELKTPLERRSKLKPGYIFAVRNGASFSHTGFVLGLNDATFDTVEGNTGAEGGNDGANAKQGSRSFAGNDFIRLT